MKNSADYTRNKTNNNFQGALPTEYPPKTKYFSPDSNYYFEMEVFSKPIDDGDTFGTYFFAKVEIFNNQNQEKIFYALHDYFGETHQWLTIDEKYYLFFPEFQKGISLYNLTDRTQNSYLTAESHYQIIQYFPSPDALKMATVQYGLQNLMVVVYDISELMKLPYPVVFKKLIEDNNGKQVKNVDWIGSSINIKYEEYVQICNHGLKVQVVGVTDDNFTAKCRFEDIHGNEYFGYEKWQAMFNFEADEDTVYPLESSISVDIENISTKNNQKIATVSVEIGYIKCENIKIEVYWSQISTYFYQYSK